MRDNIVIVDIATKKFKSIPYKQYDENNVMQLVIVENRKPVNLLGCVAIVYFELPSGNSCEIKGEVQNNSVYLTLTKEVLSESGKVIMETTLTNVDQVVTTFSLFLDVEKSIMRGSTSSTGGVTHSHINKSVLDQITQEMIDTLLSGDIADLSMFQTKSDNGLRTTSKTIVGAINELNEKIENSTDGSCDCTFDGDYNSLTNKPTIPTKISQLTNDLNFVTKTYVDDQINNNQSGNTTVDLSNYYSKTEIDNKLSNIEQIEQPNFEFKINLVEQDGDAKVTTTGTYPNMTFTFHIPSCLIKPSTTEKMWIGYIPYDSTGINGISSLNQIGENITTEEIQFGLNAETLSEVESKTFGKTSIGIVPESCYVCCIFPKSKGYTVTIDNGIGGKETFNERHGEYPVNNLQLKSQIDGVDYLVSGFLANMKGERFLYVD